MRPILGRVVYIVDSIVVFAAISGLISWIPRFGSGETATAIAVLSVMGGFGFLWGLFGYSHGRDKAHGKLNALRSMGETAAAEP